MLWVLNHPDKTFLSLPLELEEKTVIFTFCRNIYLYIFFVSHCLKILISYSAFFIIGNIFKHLYV